MRFRPRLVVLSPLNPNILFVKNLQSVLVMRFSKAGLILISNIPVLEVADTRVQWTVVAGNNTLAIVISSDTISSIQEYSVYDVYKPFFLKELNVLGDVFLSPLNVGFAVGTDFFAIETSNSNTNVQQLSIYRLDSEAVAANHFALPTNQRLMFATSRVGDDGVFELANIKAAKRVYSQPKLLILATSDPSTFKTVAPYGLTVTAPDNSLEFSGVIGVFNYQTKISERNVPNDKLQLPADSTDTRVELLVNDFFNGSVTHYEIACPWCGDKIKLVDHVSALTSITSKRPINFFLNLKQLSLVAALLDDRLEFYSNNYNFQTGKDIGITGIKCINMEYWKDNVLVLFCITTDQKQWFVPVVVQSADNIKVTPPILIEKDWQLDECFEMGFAGDQLMVLDNNRQADGNGYIRTFAIKKDGEGFTIVGGTTLDYDSFGSPNSQRIMDAAVLNTTNPDAQLVVVTLENVGLGYITFTGGEWRAGATIDLQHHAKT